MAFCDFCICEDCQNGADYMDHAQTEDGRWICDVCWLYDLCIDANRHDGSRLGPCEDENGLIIECAHRPKLVTEWIVHNPALKHGDSKD